MQRRTNPLIASLAGLTSLAFVLNACSEPAPVERELSEEAIAAVSGEPGAPTRQLARQVDDLFALEDLGETRAAVVIHNGAIAAERYAPGYNAETRFVSWSMAKTITAAMIGMLVADGKLRLDDSPPIPEWQRPGDPRGEITVRQLLQMRSGLRHTEAGDPPYDSSEVRMLFLDGRDDMAKWAKEQPLEAEPGAKFEYSSNTTVILADIAARIIAKGSEDPETRRKAVTNFLQARLFGPLGMDSVVAEYDASGTLIGGSLIHANARDWAKFGEFLRNQGAVDGAQLVPSKWVEFMTTPSPRADYYGAQTWLNVGAEQEDNPLHPIAQPAGLFAAIGHMGQYVLVSPSQQLTIVRLGHSDAPQRTELLAQLRDIVELYPVR